MYPSWLKLPTTHPQVNISLECASFFSVLPSPNQWTHCLSKESIVLNWIRETPRTPWFPRLTVKHTQPRTQHFFYQPGGVNHNDNRASNGMHPMAVSPTGRLQRVCQHQSGFWGWLGTKGTDICWVSLTVYSIYSTWLQESQCYQSSFTDNAMVSETLSDLAKVT